jgi:alpha-glucosidase
MNTSIRLRPLYFFFSVFGFFLMPCFLLSGAPASNPSPTPTPTPSPVSLQLKSPNGKLVVDFDLKPIGKDDGCPVYRVSYEGKPVIVESRLGLEQRDRCMTHNFRFLDQKTKSVDTSWKPVNGERSEIRDHYNEMTVEMQLAGPTWSASQMNITFRAYDEGVAFRYTLPEENNLPVVDILMETTQFAFAGDYPAWAINSAQGDYTHSKISLSKISPGAERPLTVQIDDHLYTSLTEAYTANYARTKFRLSKTSPNTLEAFLDAERNRDGVALDGEVMGRVPFSTPWRVVMVAESPSKLLEHNYLILNLNEPCALADTSWIKPGNVMRETSFTTEGGKACVDFAVKHGMKYLLYDAGWYGPEVDPHSDASAVAPHLQKSLNLQEVIDYGNTNGIGVILYVNHMHMDKQLDQILPLYEKWGVKGVKYGFVSVGSQYWQAFDHEAIRKAAAHHLMVDMHDEFRNCGYERTYPNLMEVEGIGGDETMPTATHNATLPFSRFLTGPADHTYCWNEKRLKNTKAHQLAISTIFFNPWSCMYWYGSPKSILDEAALDYWDHLPSTWNETRVLQGEIGKRVVVARRKGEDWFLGAIAPENRKFEIALDFLPKGKNYSAKIFEDDPVDAADPSKLPTEHAVKIIEKTVDSHSMIQADIPANGGMAIRIVPKS